MGREKLIARPLPDTRAVKFFVFASLKACKPTPHTKQAMKPSELAKNTLDDLMNGKPPSRDMGDDTPPPRGSAVPKSGNKKPRDKKGGATGDMEPQPS